MNPPADADGRLTAAAQPLTGRIRCQAPRPRMVGTPIRWRHLMPWSGPLATASAGIVRGPAWTAARVTRAVHARPRHGTAEVPE